MAPQCQGYACDWQLAGSTSHLSNVGLQESPTCAHMYGYRPTLLPTSHASCSRYQSTHGKQCGCIPPSGAYWRTQQQHARSAWPVVLCSTRLRATTVAPQAHEACCCGICIDYFGTATSMYRGLTGIPAHGTNHLHSLTRRCLIWYVYELLLGMLAQGHRLQSIHPRRLQLHKCLLACTSSRAAA